MDMDKISNYKKIVNALMKKRESINDSGYENMLKKINIIEISPINETTIKIFEEYSNTELTDSNTDLIIDNIEKYGLVEVYGDFFRRLLPGTVSYSNASKVTRLFCDDDYNLDRYTDVLTLIKNKQKELRTELSRTIRELICESRINYNSNEYTYLDSVPDTNIVLNTIASILGAATKSELRFELKYILGKEIDPRIYKFNMIDIKVICDYFDIDYTEIEGVFNRLR
jgi:hypothetical protein